MQQQPDDNFEPAPVPVRAPTNDEVELNELLAGRHQLSATYFSTQGATTSREREERAQVIAYVTGLFNRVSQYREVHGNTFGERPTLEPDGSLMHRMPSGELVPTDEWMDVANAGTIREGQRFDYEAAAGEGDDDDDDDDEPPRASIYQPPVEASDASAMWRTGSDGVLRPTSAWHEAARAAGPRP